MSTVKLNDYFRKHGLNALWPGDDHYDAIKKLKALRRRIKNRGYTRKDRAKKRAKASDKGEQADTIVVDNSEPPEEPAVP